jgi:nucleoside-diphosphate-sugar epimerase
MIGKGEVHSHLVFIDDLIDAYELVTEIEEALGEIFIIGQKQSITLNDMVKIISEVLEVPSPRWRFPLIWPALLACWGFEAIGKPLGMEPSLFRRKIDFFRKNHSFDISKARRELGFEPKYEFKDGAKITADWYKRYCWL